MTVTKHIDLSIYRENLRQIVGVMSPSRVMAVIKADGYGHGLVETAQAATDAGIDFLGVLDIETGLTLRKAGIETPAFAWLHSIDSDFGAAVFAGIDLSVGSMHELEVVSKTEGRAQVHLKIDTGLSRNGCRPEQWIPLVSRAMQLQSEGEIDVVAIWSHLSGTSIEEDTIALDKFEITSEQARNLGFSGYRHVASSPAAFALPQSRYDLVRIGVSAFGTSPIEGVSASSLSLGTPMTLTAEVLSPGIVSIGFLHGFFSQLAGKTHFEIEGKTYKVEKIGPLASQIELGNYSVGSKVTVFDSGANLAESAETLCEKVGTVTDELFTGLKTNSITYA
ncbi:MAG: alanine racemase [Actinomycetota bacterium]